MRMRRGAILALILAIPSAAALPAGTEDDPELRDQEGDIDYSPVDLERASDFIDISAGWFEYDAPSDAIVYQLRVKDATGLAQPKVDPDWRCETGLEMFGAESKTGSMSIQWVKNYGASTIRSTAAFARGQGAPTAG